MKDAKFNPIPENREMAIGYNPEAVAKMSREDFGKSSLALALAYGQEVNAEMKGKWLDAWHEDAKRIYAAANPTPEVKAPVKTK